MKQELGLVYDVKSVMDMSLHQPFGLMTKGEGGLMSFQRGYAIVKDGIIIEAEKTDTAGERSLEIMQKAAELK